MAKSVIETPAAFCDQLSVIEFSADIFEVPSHSPTNVLSKDSQYVVEVSIELGAKIKRLISGEWCISVAAESIGPGSEKRMTKVIAMDNCDPSPDRARFNLPNDWFDAPGDHCGQVYYLVVTVVARDSCKHEPIGIAGFSRLGPVMVV